MEATKHEDDLLAEALLLQEELGVDLAVCILFFSIFSLCSSLFYLKFR